ncbi:hypothetical protein DB42_CT00500 [Neochlamydia sp. EPS4]|nr:hypothetical protein DB42_CT00500 [Neochlamydia sp. EPS4]
MHSMAPKENLPKREWVVIICLILFMIVLTCLTHKHRFLSSRKYSEPHHLYNRQQTVRVEGAVEYPGLYNVEKTATLANVLEQAKVHLEADLSKISLNKKVNNSQLIKVPYKEYITVRVEGAVKKRGSLTVLRGTLMEDLIKLIEPLEKADVGRLKRKRKLRDGEIIKVLIKEKLLRDNCKGECKSFE